MKNFLKRLYVDLNTLDPLFKDYWLVIISELLSLFFTLFPFTCLDDDETIFDFFFRKILFPNVSSKYLNDKTMAMADNTIGTTAGNAYGYFFKNSLSFNL